MKCIHCLEEGIVTRDHVFPKSWYPDDTPENVQRPTAPACRTCNEKLGAIEDELFQKLAVCINPKIAAASGIKEKVYRSFGVGVQESKMSGRDRSARLKRLERLINVTKSFSHTEMEAFPGLGPHEGFPSESQKAFPAPTRELETVSKKIIRGMEYWLAKRYVEEPLEVEAYIYIKNEIPDVQRLLTTLGKQHIYGPGFEVTRVSGESGLAVIYKFLIWKTIKVYGSVMTPDES